MKKTNIILFTLIVLLLNCKTNRTIKSVVENSGESSYSAASTKQTVYYVLRDGIFVEEVPDRIPELKGGLESLKSVYMTLKYPAKARENSVSGRVEFLVTVNEQGQMTEYQLIKGIGSGCDEAAISAIQKMQLIGFEPAISKGMPIYVQYILPIKFGLGG